MFQIKFNLPNLPEGGEIDIHGLPYIFKNGSAYNIDEAHAAAYLAETGRPLDEAFEDNEFVTVTKGGTE
jgi:hypothetical protein